MCVCVCAPVWARNLSRPDVTSYICFVWIDVDMKRQPVG